jgi:hypothetical protein
LLSLRAGLRLPGMVEHAVRRRKFKIGGREMRKTATYALTLIAGFAIGAGAIDALHAQAEKKPAYLVAEVELTNPDAFKEYQKKAMETLSPIRLAFLRTANRM